MTPTVALTFDDGPSIWTLHLLDVLEKHDARATFFVLGCNIAGQEGFVERMVSEGHEIGVHGWDHTRMPSLHMNDLRQRIRKTEVALMAAGAPKPTLWRAPWNDVTTEVIRTFDSFGYEHAPAELDGRDVSKDAAAIVRLVVPKLRDKLVVGLHDGIAENGEQLSRSREATIAATARILEACRSVTVSEIREKVAA